MPVWEVGNQATSLRTHPLLAIAKESNLVPNSKVYECCMFSLCRSADILISI